MNPNDEIFEITVVDPYGKAVKDTNGMVVGVRDVLPDGTASVRIGDVGAIYKAETGQNRNPRAQTAIATKDGIFYVNIDLERLFKDYDAENPPASMSETERLIFAASGKVIFSPSAPEQAARGAKPPSPKAG